METSYIPASPPGFGVIMEMPYIPASPPGVVRAGMEGQQPRPVGPGWPGIAATLAGARIINRENAWESGEEKDACTTYSRRAAVLQSPGLAVVLPRGPFPKNKLLKVLGCF